MNAWQFLSNILTAWAWPVAVVFVALIFKKQVAALLGNLQSLEGPAGLKAVFAARVAEVSKQVTVESLPTPEREEFLLKSWPAAEMIKDADKAERARNLGGFLLRSAGRFRASTIVLDAWERLEDELLRLFAPKLEHGEPIFSITMLTEAGLSPAIVSNVIELLALRNKVVNSSDFEPNQESALEYSKSVERLINIARAYKAALPPANQRSMGRD